MTTEVKEKLARVVVTHLMVGICHMAVCAEADATDEEILEVCNRDNMSGTTGGWCHVIRENEPEPESEAWPAEKLKPVQCADYPGRMHFLVNC